MPSIFQLEGPASQATYQPLRDYSPTVKHWLAIGAGLVTLGVIVAKVLLKHEDKQIGSPRDIAQRASSVEDYATRVEAWSAGEARPPSMESMAKAYPKAKPAKVKRLIREAREQRIESRERLWSRMGRGLRGKLSGYRVAFLERGVREVTDHPFDTPETAASMVRAYKRRGWTAWVEDEAGNFVPVKGAMKPTKAMLKK